MRVLAPAVFLSLALLAVGHAEEAATLVQKAMATATEVTVYEGLPHSVFQKESFEWEWKRKDIFQSNGHFFYAEPVAKNATASKGIAKVLGKPDALPKFSGSKYSGIFHPDYMFVWTMPEGDVCAQVCLGCHEVKVFDKKVTAQADLSPGAREGLKRVLEPYRKVVHAEAPEINPWDLTAKDLIAMSPVIAVIDVSATIKLPPQDEDPALDFPIFKNRTKAQSLRVIKGKLPAIILLECGDDAVLSEGEHLAFLRPLDERRYALSSVVSLRRIKDGQVYWFPHIYMPVEEVVAEILAEEKK